MNTISLKLLIKDARPGFASGERDEDGIIQVRMNNVSTDGKLSLDDVIRVPVKQQKIVEYHLVVSDVLFNSTNSPKLVGKSAVFAGHREPVVYSNHFLRIRVDDLQLDARYLARWLNAQWQRGIFEGMCTQWVNQASVPRDRLLEMKIPVPSLIEQRRIAAILDKADSLREKRRQAIAKLDELTRSVFIEMFGDPMTNPKGWPITQLGEVAEVSSGAMKGRKFNGNATVHMPYLRVANVQDGYLDLQEVKDIEVLEKDVDRYKLEVGDILMTEGGDPDKLGRGAIWRGEIKDCLHQNHIFRVRVDSKALIAEYLNALSSSESGKKYFLRAAKQTTGIATINMTQLRRFPVLLPPIPLQREYANVVGHIKGLTWKIQAGSEKLDNLFRSLQKQAFTGDLFNEQTQSVHH